MAMMPTTTSISTSVKEDFFILIQYSSRKEVLCARVAGSGRPDSSPLYFKPPPRKMQFRGGKKIGFSRVSGLHFPIHGLK
jgi:hypothetical protein